MKAALRVALMDGKSAETKALLWERLRVVQWAALRVVQMVDQKASRSADQKAG